MGWQRRLMGKIEKTVWADPRMVFGAMKQFGVVFSLKIIMPWVIFEVVDWKVTTFFENWEKRRNGGQLRRGIRGFFSLRNVVRQFLRCFFLSIVWDNHVRSCIHVEIETEVCQFGTKLWRETILVVDTLNKSEPWELTMESIEKFKIGLKQPPTSCQRFKKHGDKLENLMCSSNRTTSNAFADLYIVGWCRESGLILGCDDLSTSRFECFCDDVERKVEVNRLLEKYRETRYNKHIHTWKNLMQLKINANAYVNLSKEFELECLVPMEGKRLQASGNDSFAQLEKIVTEQLEVLQKVVKVELVGSDGPPKKVQQAKHNVSWLDAESLYKTGGDQNALPVDIAKFLQLVESDVLIFPGDGNAVKSHKFILSSHSEVLAALFKDEAEDVTMHTVKMPELTEEDVKAFVAFLYFSDKSVPNAKIDVAIKLLEAGVKYKISKLQNAMNDLLLSKEDDWFDVHTALKSFLLARTLPDNKGNQLKGKVARVLNKNHWSFRLAIPYKKLSDNDPDAGLDLCGYTYRARFQEKPVNTKLSFKLDLNENLLVRCYAYYGL